jgi:hypothetical protein
MIRKSLAQLMIAALLMLSGCTGARKPAPPAGSPSAIAQPGLFQDVAGAAGIRFQHASGATTDHRFAEITGSGCAFLDFDRDGWLDVFLLDAGSLDSGKPPARNALYRNVEGRFQDITEDSGLVSTGYSQGVAVGDYDNDGYPDLYVTAYGRNHLFHNERGSGRFKDVTEPAGVADVDQGPRYSLSAAWGDYDRDGDLDLFVTHYVVWRPETDQPCVNALGKRGYCSPEKYQGDRSRLYRNEGNGTFKDVSERTRIGQAKGRAMGAVWLDFDDDGWEDLFVTCDLTPNLLFRNTGKGGFEEVALDANVAYGEMGTPLSGMGVAAGDYDNDGREDLHVTNFSHQPNSLFLNRGRGLFENTSVLSGIAEPSNLLLGWGCEFLDYDLDGRQDVVVANGHIQEEIARLVPGLTYAQPKSLYRNLGDGLFRSLPDGIGDLAVPTVARGLAVGDYNNDGRPDLLVNNQNGAAQLLRNQGTGTAHSLSIELVGRRSNRDGQQARITVYAAGKRQVRRARTNGSFCSSSDPRVLFGTGTAVTVDRVEVRWPGGATVLTRHLASDRIWRWTEGEPAPRELRRMNSGRPQ